MPVQEPTRDQPYYSEKPAQLVAFTTCWEYKGNILDVIPVYLAKNDLIASLLRDQHNIY